jgi:RNA polymerase sigma-54 factor
MEELIGNLDDKGFLTEPPEAPTLLPLLHTFDPPGVGAKNLQHSLLLQLARKKQQETLAYRLIEHHYDDFIHGRKNLPCTPRELREAIHLLSCLSLDPAAPFRPQTLLPQTPDIFVESQAGSWSITLNDSLLPRFKLNPAPELSRFEPSARWIQKMVSRRGEIIIAIVKIVLEVQHDFFLGKTSDLQPLSFKHVAHKLSLHESTISRAVKEKTLASPRGIHPLRLFFPHTSAGSVSHHTVKERIKAAIDQEDKQSPFSDEALAALLRTQGIPCARRTVTKYRTSLALASARVRRRLLS